MKLKTAFLLATIILLFSSISMAATEQEIIQIATQEFQKIVPSDVRNEYSKFSIGTDAQGTVYWLTWQRMIQDIPIIDDKLFLRIYPSGTIINHEYSHSYSASEFDTIPIITKDQAEWFMQKQGKFMNIGSSEAYGNPYLAIKDKKLIWIGYIDVGKGIIELGVDSKTGQSEILAASQSWSFSLTNTTIDIRQYYLETYGLYAVITAVVVIGGGYLYYKKKMFVNNKK